MQKYYIAFSIAGTNTFIIAKKEVPGLPLTPKALEAQGFTIAQSRRPNYNAQRDGIKLHWDKLVSTKTKKPYTNPSWIIRRFAELQNLGWEVINRPKFTEKNFKRGYKVPLPASALPPHLQLSKAQ